MTPQTGTNKKKEYWCGACLCLLACSWIIILRGARERNRCTYLVWWHIAAKVWWHIATKVSWHIAAKVWWHIATKVSWHIAAKVWWHIAAKAWWHIAAKDWHLRAQKEEQTRCTHSHTCMPPQDAYTRAHECLLATVPSSHLHYCKLNPNQTRSPLSFSISLGWPAFQKYKQHLWHWAPVYHSVLSFFLWFCFSYWCWASCTLRLRSHARTVECIDYVYMYVCI